MSARFDHVVVAVPDVAAAAQQWTAAGLRAAVGGRHPGGTQNALIRGPDAAYLELIGIADGGVGAWADRVRGRHGPLSWAIAVEDIEQARSALITAGFTPEEVVPGARTTPSGDTLAWQLCDVGSQPFDAELPFLIQWMHGMPSGPADGPRLVSVVVGSPNPQRLATLLRAVGVAESATFPGVVFGDPSECTIALVADPVGVGRVSVSVPSWSGPAQVELDGLELSVSADSRRLRGWPLLETVDAIFADRVGLPGWLDPHADRAPLEEEYSRCLDPERYRILSARADAWMGALVDRGLAIVTEVQPAALTTVGGAPWSGVTRLAPQVAGGVPLWLARRGFDGTEGTIVGVFAGDPPLALTVQPDCGCDACDSGSADLLDALDSAILTVLDGGVIAVVSGSRYVIRTVSGWSASGLSGPDEPERWLRDAEQGRLPRRGRAIAGAPWL